MTENTFVHMVFAIFNFKKLNKFSLDIWEQQLAYFAYSLIKSCLNE